MRHFAMLVILFSSLSMTALATPVEKLKFSCATGMPTTSFFLRTEGDYAVLQTIHHNGVRFMPIHHGIIVPNDLPYLTKKSEILPKMGEITEFRFPLKRCETFGPELMACHGGEKKIINVTEIEVMSVTTSISIRQVYDYKFKGYNVTIGVRISGLDPVQDVTMAYEEGDCTFSW